MRGNNSGFSKKQIITISAIVLVLLAVLITALVYRSKIRATTMRLLRIEGTVTMEENGRMKDIRENARLKSGNAIDTSVQSLASIGLDDYKVVTLDEVSRAEFNQSGKYLNLNLRKGSLFFEVDKALADDETFEIETSTMIVGIRGTSGWVSVAGENESLIVTDGHIHLIGTNPVTGEVKEIEVSAGQRVSVYLYNDREVDSIMFELEDITERDLPDFVLARLRENPELLDRVINATGWDKPWILGEDETEPEQEEEPDEGGNDSTTSTTPEPEPDNVDETGDSDEVGDIGGNDNDHEPVADNTNVVTPVAVPTVSALDRQKEEAKAKIASVNDDGTLTLTDGTVFDPEYYAERYPEVAEVYGDDAESLLAHYIAHGSEEGRYASNDEEQAAELAEDLARLEEQKQASDASDNQQTQPTSTQ
ncbi:MAG: FecR domain-containing protein [Lachnospiraceae bacterium]|nr:FecR domain-containing protein [Lachnospiraceae bacterium]